MQTNSSKSASGSLVACGIAAVVASVCCVGPLVLLAFGIGGAWMANVTALEPYRPVFVVIALIFLGLALRKLYLVHAACAPDRACAVPVGRARQRLIFWLVAIPLLALLAFPWYAPLFYKRRTPCVNFYFLRPWSSLGSASAPRLPLSPPMRLPARR